MLAVLEFTNDRIKQNSILFIYKSRHIHDIASIDPIFCILATNDNLYPPLRMKPLISRANLCMNELLPPGRKKGPSGPFF
ncbi:hypothetical protein DD568_09300 [Klebsiella pneumoniae]|nr:hypothetical protein DD568_09300 [Klebsiella pneumoniae]